MQINSLFCRIIESLSNVMKNIETPNMNPLSIKLKNIKAYSYVYTNITDFAIGIHGGKKKLIYNIITKKF